MKTAPEASDAQRIAETARQYGATDLGNNFIAKGRSYEEFNSALIREHHGQHV